MGKPIRKAKPPKVPLELLEPVSLEDISAIIEICDKTFNGLRDKAILIGLLDTGARADEFLGMKLDDLNLVTGEILIRQGKGGKFRTVFLGKTSRRSRPSLSKIPHRYINCINGILQWQTAFLLGIKRNHPKAVKEGEHQNALTTFLPQSFRYQYARCRS